MSEDFDETVVRSPTVPTEHPPVRSAPPPPARRGIYFFQVGSRAEAIPLDRPCFVGRRPSGPRVIQGPAPRLLMVPSPNSEVSATHLEVRQVGLTVVVTDLKSTNGSVVMVPGTVPRKLRQGESVVVTPGTLVDIGDDNIIQILPLRIPGQADRDTREAEDTR